MTAQVTLAPNVVPADLGLTVICSWCRTVMHQGSDMREDALVSHGICVECFDKVKRESPRRVPGNQ